MAPRRSPGEGSVHRRKAGGWQASLQVDGVRRTVYGKTRSEAAAKLQDLKRQVSSTGRLANPKGRTLDSLLDAWLESKAPNLKARTLDDYRATLETHVRPTLGSLPLAKVTPDRIARLLARLQTADKHRTAQLVFLRLRQAFAMAVRWGWLASNPCERVDAPQHQAERKTPWTPEQLRRFLDGTAGHWLHPLWTVAVSSGCRLGELLALEWSDVVLSTGKLSVTKSTQYVGGEWVVTEPKTRAGTRVVTLPPEGVKALHRQAAYRLSHGAGPLVFASPTGGPLHRSVVSHAMRVQCLRLGLPLVSPHGLRHLHASLLLVEGLPLPEVSARLGHANSAITAQVYSHAVRDDTAATEAIRRALAEGGRL